MNTTFDAGQEVSDKQRSESPEGFVDAQEETAAHVQPEQQFPRTPQTQASNNLVASGCATISRGSRPPVDISPILPSPKQEPKPERYGDRQRQKTMVVESGIVSDMRKYLSGLQNRDEEAERTLMAMLAKSEAESSRNAVEMSRLRFKLFTCKEIMQIYARNQQSIEDLPIGSISLAMANGGCQGECECSKKLRVDMDSLKNDHDELYREYSALFDMYGKVKQAAHSQRGEMEKFEQKMVEEREDHQKLKAKFLRLKENASEQLGRASQEMDDVEKKHAADTQGLRMKVRTLEMQLKNAGNEVELKRKEVDELREMVKMVLNEVEPGSDVESERGL